jgi:site-specific DNA-adenine methylase
MRKYGVPYQGSKSQIAEWIVGLLPAGDTLIDLFAVGCAVTHCAMQSGKWNEIITNDIDDAGIQLFDGAIHGKYKDESRWISREMFFALKDSDPYVRYCWSFGYDGRSYLYSEDREYCLEPIWRMIFAKTTKEARHQWREFCRRKKNDNYYRGNLDSLTRLERIIGLERLGRIQSLESLESLETSNKDYRSVTIPDNAIVYCDIPYKGTKGYGIDFDYEAFYDWCLRQTVPVFISEYSMPEDKFEIVAEKSKRNTQGANANIKVIERLYRPKK